MIRYENEEIDEVVERSVCFPEISPSMTAILRNAAIPVYNCELDTSKKDGFDP